jgi:MoaA/NifB/PqqE/SkfB family radical SAM enzyme
MEPLEKIGFYTLSDMRRRTISGYVGGYRNFPGLSRCELLITDACNFKCPYCRGCAEEFKGTMKASAAFNTLHHWVSDGLKNVRFSGGEPTLHPHLVEMVKFCKLNGVKRIALSTNGSAPPAQYEALVEAGVNDFSISLDACCADKGDEMAGVKGYFPVVVDNIRYLSSKTYVTVGVVLTDSNVADMLKTVTFAHELGVADIRIISSAQENKELADAINIPQDILDAHPILAYRVRHIKEGRNVRGIKETDCNRCPLVLDDMAVLGDKHFPCIIYLREGGKPIGTVGPDMMLERAVWYRDHDTHKDPICKKNCLDVCVDYNNAVEHELKLMGE